MSHARRAFAGAVTVVNTFAGGVKVSHEMPAGSSIHDFSDLA
jgi:hypothetical protein